MSISLLARGAQRDGAVRGVRISRDWNANPPRELWRRRVGPGWSSFVTIGDVAFTQEQRGEEEATVALDIASGQELWSHTDQGRFWEVVAGAGPRSTPTFAAGKLYAQGASGTLDCLDAATGKLVWSRDIKADAGVKDPPQWGYSSSPLVASGVVVTFAGGGKERGEQQGSINEYRESVHGDLFRQGFRHHSGCRNGNYFPCIAERANVN